VQTDDIEYNGYALPYTASRDYWLGTDGAVGFFSNGIQLPLSQNKQLRVIDNTDITGYRGFDTDNYPEVNPSSNQSIGQPFQSTVFTKDFGSKLITDKDYFLVFNYDSATSEPFMTIVENETTLGDKENDIMAVLRLEPTDSTMEFYELKVVELRTHQRFYSGTLGLSNLESVSVEYDRMANRTDSVERIRFAFNKDGNSPEFSALIDGVVYSFSSGFIETPKYTEDSWDRNKSEYNLNLIINTPDSPETNYGATLEITSETPLSNQITVAKIYTNFIDPDTGTPTLLTRRGQRFGDFQVVEEIDVTTDNQKAGTVEFNAGETSSKVIFTNPFESDKYQVTLTTQEPLRKWVSAKNVNGFTVYVEPDTEFTGKVGWVATEVIEEHITEIDVVFDTPLAQSVSPDGVISDYMVQLTPNDNIEIWYDKLTETGFTIRTEKNFHGKVSWSVYNFFGDDEVPSEEISSDQH
jgi:hypothetical protein